ncbi:MAG: hypothetical protein AB7G68_14260 [Nitrospiraceae bacterium]
MSMALLVRHSLIMPVIVLAAGCSFFTGGPRPPEDIRSPETEVDKRPLPASAPIPARLEFDDPPDGSRVRVKNATALPDSAVVHSPDAALPSAVEFQARAAANTAVRNLLGERYALISVHPADPPHKFDLGCCSPAPPLMEGTFYSYSHDAAVEVALRGERIVSVRQRKDYLPPESEEELDQAVELARKDDRIAASIQGLEGHAILMQPGDGIIFNDPGYGHRVFWVTFSQGVSGNPEYWAVVDLSERKVLKADKEEPHP